MRWSLWIVHPDRHTIKNLQRNKLKKKSLDKEWTTYFILKYHVYCSMKCEKQYAEKAMKDCMVEFLVWTRFERLNCFIDVWFCRTVLIYSISPTKSICSTFDFAPTACSFVTVTYTVVYHITIYKTWKVEVKNLRFSDYEVHEFCMNKNHFLKLGLPALTVRSDSYALCRLRVYFPWDYKKISQKLMHVKTQIQ